ncbi:MAG: ATP-binding cassette domain-containing protein [Cyanobacteriota bacterium]|nr:ATP-binding cassette domain-containing protein [Cyanobacteriota bacterium]
MQPSALFSAIGLCRSLGGRMLWRDIELTLRAGDRLALVAPSGQGKTLLLRNLALLDPLQRGALNLQGRSPASWGLPAWRARVTYLSQRPVAHAGTVEENLRRVWSYGSQRHRGAWQPGRMGGWLERLGRPLSFLGYPAERLSGGELQLLSLLRALQLDPVVLLLDEPCASLDASTTLAVEALLRDWLVADARACVLTSHDPEQIGRFTTARLELKSP